MLRSRIRSRIRPLAVVWSGVTALGLLVLVVRWATSGPNTSCIAGGGTFVEGAVCMLLDVIAQLVFAWILIGVPATIVLLLWPARGTSS